MAKYNKLSKEDLAIVDGVIRDYLGELEDGETPQWSSLSKRIQKEYKIKMGGDSLRSRGKRQFNYSKESTSFQQISENEARVNSSSAMIDNVDDLLKKMKVDMDEWVLGPAEIKQRYVKYIPDLHKNLEAVRGRWSGTTRRGPDKFMPIYNIDVKLFRKVPYTPELPVSSITPLKTYQKPNTPVLGDQIILRLQGGDQQVGAKRMDDGHIRLYHDDSAMDIFVQVAAGISPDIIDLMGDGMDWAEFSKYTTTPSQYGLGNYSLRRFHYHLARLRDPNPLAKINKLPSNHGNRVISAVQTNLAGLLGLKRVDSLHLPDVYHPDYLLALDILGIETDFDEYPDGEEWWNDYIKSIHGVKTGGGKSGATAVALLNSEDESTGQGHNHRLEMGMKTLWKKGKPRFKMAWSTGGLSKPYDGAPNRSKKNNHQQGFVLCEYNKRSQVPSITFVPIIEGEAILRGKNYVGVFDHDRFVKTMKLESMFSPCVQ